MLRSIIKHIRGLCRFVKQIIIYIPLLVIILLMLSYPLFKIGFGLSWYSNYTDCIHSLVSPFLGALISTCVITFISNENRRRKQLNQQYNYLYSLITATSWFFEAVNIVFSFNCHIPYIAYAKNNDEAKEIIENLPFYKIEETTVNCEEQLNDNISGRMNNRIYSKLDILNRYTHNLLNIISFNLIPNYTENWNVNKELISYISQTEIRFYSTNNFSWNNLNSNEIRYLIESLIYVTFEIDKILGKPWRKDIKLDNLIEFYKSKHLNLKYP